MRLRYDLLMFTVFAMATGLTGCASSDESNPVPTFEVGRETQGTGAFYEPPSGRNGLRPSEFWSATAQNAYRDIQHQPLKNGSFFNGADWIPVLNAPSGSPMQQLLSTYPTAATYLVECALDQYQVVHDDVTGQDIQGWFGLAPYWMDQAIDTNLDAQEWVTACMVARLNFQGLTVNILLEGDTPAVQTNPVWNSVMNYEESTLRGNMFAPQGLAPTGKPAFYAYVCRENYLIDTCTNDGGQAYLYDRICDDAPGICGLVDLGYCDPARPGSGQYGACAPGGPEHWNCRDGLAATNYEFRTIGVQYELEIPQSACH